MTIVDKIIASIHTALDTVDDNGETVEFPVYYHDDQTLNLMTSTMRFPCALVMLLTTGSVVREAGQLKERVSAAVFFVEPSQFDFDAVENEAIVDRCKTRGMQWLGGINADSYIDATLTRTERTYDRYDDILTGMGFLVDVTEQQGHYDCPEPIPPRPRPVKEAEENDVNFYDYDGFRVASFTIAQAKALTQAQYNAILPPTHEGLTFQEWNWSLNDITTYNRRYIDIGANYVTTDGKTHLYIKTLANTVNLRLRILNGTVTVDWGDGTSDTYTRTTVGNTDIEHNAYFANTDYEIKLSFQQSSDDGYYGVTTKRPITFITKEVNFGSYFHQDNAAIFMGGNDVKISNPISNSSGSHYTYGSSYSCYVIPKGNDINITQFASFYMTPCKTIFPKEVKSITSLNCCASQYNYKIVLPNITGSSAYGTGMFNNSRVYVISLPNKDLPSGDNNFLNSATLIELDIVQGWIPNTNIKLSTSTNWIAETMVDFFTKLGTTSNNITLTFGSTNLGKLTEDQKAIATNKGYTLA